MKGAYGSIPRHRLLEIISKRLPAQPVDMIAFFLTPETISTVGDSHTATVARGVPEGIPLCGAKVHSDHYIDE